MYTKTLYAGWGGMDFNAQMGNTAYFNKAADVRQMFLIENGFPVEEFRRLDRESQNTVFANAARVDRLDPGFGFQVDFMPPYG